MTLHVPVDVELAAFAENDDLLRITLTGDYDPTAALPHHLASLSRRQLPEASAAPARARSHSPASARLRRAWASTSAYLATVGTAHPELLDVPGSSIQSRLLTDASRLRSAADGSFIDRRLVQAAIDQATALEWTAQRLERPWPDVRDATVLMSGCTRTTSTRIIRDRGQLRFSSRQISHRHAPELTGFHYGSPWWLDATLWVASTRVAVGSLAGILAMLRRYGAVDLEVRLRRARLRAQLLEAQAIVEELEQRRGERQTLAGGPLEAEPYDGPAFFPWVLRRARLTDGSDGPPSLSSGDEPAAER